jgi:uncharacterized SAM-binding protein YcdF (DUF218 family)
MASNRVVAVLGYSGRKDLELNAICAARLARAEELVEPDDTVVLSGWGRAADRSEAALMAAAWGGASADLILDPDSRSTAANARSVVAHAKAVGAEELVVVTSSWHRPRANILLRAASHGTGIRLRMISAPPTWPLLPTAREVVCLLVLPLQVAAARRRARR